MFNERSRRIERIGNHTLEVYENPTSLPDEVQTQLVQELTPVTGRGFLRNDIHSDELYQDVANHVINCDRLTIARSGGEVSAFMAQSTVKKGFKKIFHLEGIIVEPAFRSSGLASKMIKKGMKGHSILAFHTQSKAMLKLGEKLSKRDDGLAEQIAYIIGSGDARGNVDVGRYGGQSLYENTSKFARTAIKEIDWENGDAQIFAGKI